MTEEDAPSGVDSESGRVVTIVSILVKIVIQISMSGNDVRLSISLLVWSNCGEQDESGFPRLEYIASPSQDRSIRIDIIRAQNYKIVIDLNGGSGDRVCEPKGIFLMRGADRNSKVSRREKLNDACLPDVRPPQRSSQRQSTFNASIDLSSNVCPSISINALGKVPPTSPILVAFPAAGIIPIKEPIHSPIRINPCLN